MKGSILLITVLGFLNLVEDKNCWCGSFESGMVRYSVEEGTSCDDYQFTSEGGMLGTYEESEGQWILVDVVSISFSDVKTRCSKK